MRGTSLPLWLVLGSFLSAAIQVRSALPLKLGEYFERANVARTFAARGEFADPFTSLSTGPTTHVSPIYPIFLGGVFRFFGETTAGALFLTAFCLLAHILYPILLFLLVRHIFDDAAVPLAVGATAIVVPHVPPMIQVETIYLVDLLLLSFLLTLRMAVSGSSRSRQAVLAGLLGGICTLLNASAVVIWLLWAGYLHKRAGGRGRQLYTSAFLFLVSFMAAVSPWVLRNALVFGKPILLRGNLGLELAVSNCDGAAASLSENLSSGIQNRFHPNFRIEEAEVVRSVGEVEYNRRKWSEFSDWVARNPARFVALTAERIRLFWFPAWGDAASAYIISVRLLTLLAGAGLIALLRDGNAYAYLALAVYASYPALLYFVQASLLYTLPIIWLHVICTGYLIASVPAVRRMSVRLKGLY